VMKLMKSQANAESQKQNGSTPASVCSKEERSTLSRTRKREKEAARNEKPRTRLKAIRKPDKDLCVT